MQIQSMIKIQAITQSIRLSTLTHFSNSLLFQIRHRELSKRFSSFDSSVALTWVEPEHAWAELSMSWAYSDFLRLRLELFFNLWVACWLDFVRILWQLKLWSRRRRRINSSRTIKTSSSRQNQLNFLAQSWHWTVSLAIVSWAHSLLYESCHQSANARSSFSMQISMRLLFATLLQSTSDLHLFRISQKIISSCFYLITSKLSCLNRESCWYHWIFLRSRFTLTIVRRYEVNAFICTMSRSGSKPDLSRSFHLRFIHSVT